MPHYKSAKMGTVAATKSTNRKLESECAVFMAKQPKAKAAAGPVGDAEACPALPRGVQPLTQLQAKRVAKTIEAISAYSIELAQLIDEVGRSLMLPTFRRFSCLRQGCTRPPSRSSRRPSTP